MPNNQPVAKKGLNDDPNLAQKGGMIMPISAAQITSQMPPRKAGENRRSFAFFIHPTDETDSIRGLNAAFPSFSSERIASILDWARGFSEYRMNAEAVYYTESIRSATGCNVEGWLIFSTFTAQEMVKMKKAEKERLLQSYLDTAKDLQVDYIGLGAFTSILSRAGVFFKDKGVAVTTGNSYTAMSSVHAVRELLEQKNMRSSDQSIAVVGAYGSIGRIVSLHACSHYKSIKLIGNSANNKSISLLTALADELIEQCQFCFEKSTEEASASLVNVLATSVATTLRNQGLLGQSVSFNEYLSACQRQRTAPVIEISNIADASIGTDIVYCATSNAGSFITPLQLQGVSVVCDISRPTDLNPALLTDSTTEYIEGGLSYMPEDVSFGEENLQGFPPGINLGCLCETIALSMEGDGQNYSIGAHVSLAEATHVYHICLKHGFRPYLKKFRGENDNV